MEKIAFGGIDAACRRMRSACAQPNAQRVLGEGRWVGCQQGARLCSRSPAAVPFGCQRLACSRPRLAAASASAVARAAVGGIA